MGEKMQRLQFTRIQSPILGLYRAEAEGFEYTIAYPLNGSPCPFRIFREEASTRVRARVNDVPMTTLADAIDLAQQDFERMLRERSPEDVPDAESDAEHARRITRRASYDALVAVEDCFRRTVHPSIGDGLTEAAQKLGIGEQWKARGR